MARALYTRPGIRAKGRCPSPARRFRAKQGLDRARSPLIGPASLSTIDTVIRMATARALTSNERGRSFSTRSSLEPRRTAVTDIDPGAKISIGRSYDVNEDHDRDHLVVRIPLAERVDQDCIRWYQRLARVKGISARAEDLPERNSVRIDVPGYIAPDRIRALLDTARALFRDADAALEKPPPMAEAEYAVREWWSEQGR